MGLLAASCANAFLAIVCGKHRHHVKVRSGRGRFPQFMTHQHHQQEGTWKACSTFTASLALVSKNGISPLDAHHAFAYVETRCQRVIHKLTGLLKDDLAGGHLPFGHQVRFVTQNHKWKVLCVARGGVSQKLVHPGLQIVETLRVCDIVDKHTRVGSSVKGDA